MCSEDMEQAPHGYLVRSLPGSLSLTVAIEKSKESVVNHVVVKSGVVYYRPARTLFKVSRDRRRVNFMICI